MSTAFEDQVREALDDAPEPDWRAFRAAVEERAGHQRRARMLRASLGGIAAAAAVVAIAVSAASTPLFDGLGVTPARNATPSPSGSPSSVVPDFTAFHPRVKLPNGDYRLPMAFPDVAPRGEDLPQGLTRSAQNVGMWPGATVASAACLRTTKAASPQPWGSSYWTYERAGQSEREPAGVVTLAGWPRESAVTAMDQLNQNSGACTFDRAFRKIAWPGRAVTQANQFVVDGADHSDLSTYVAIQRVGDVTVDAWLQGSDEQESLAQARSMVDAAVARLVASKTLDTPEPALFEWPDGTSEGYPPLESFILPAIAPAAEVVGVRGFTRRDLSSNSAFNSVPAMGALIGDPQYPGEEPVAVREADYELPMPDQGTDGGLANTSIVWSSFPDGQKAFDQIVANKGTARWWAPTQREAWAGHDDSKTFLATQSTRPRPLQIAMRLEGNVLIAVVAQAGTQEQARSIATRLADESAKNLAAFGRGPDGRPGNGK